MRRPGLAERRHGVGEPTKGQEGMGTGWGTAEGMGGSYTWGIDQVNKLRITGIGRARWPRKYILKTGERARRRRQKTLGA